MLCKSIPNISRPYHASSATRISGKLAPVPMHFVPSLVHIPLLSGAITILSLLQHSNLQTAISCRTYIHLQQPHTCIYRISAALRHHHLSVHSTSKSKITASNPTLSQTNNHWKRTITEGATLKTTTNDNISPLKPAPIANSL